MACLYFDPGMGAEWNFAHETNETIDDIKRKNSLVKPTITNAEQTEEE
jgi:hypothetical protein